MGFLAGNHFSNGHSTKEGGRKEEERPAFLRPPGKEVREMVYNITYSSEGPESDEAWEAMFPRMTLPVSRPSLSPSPSTLPTVVYSLL